MEEFTDLGDFGVAGGFFLEEILHRFHVVVGGFLDGLDAFGIGLGKPGGDLVQQGVGVGA